MITEHTPRPHPWPPDGHPQADARSWPPGCRHVAAGRLHASQLRPDSHPMAARLPPAAPYGCPQPTCFPAVCSSRQIVTRLLAVGRCRPPASRLAKLVTRYQAVCLRFTPVLTFYLAVACPITLCVTRLNPGHNLPGRHQFAGQLATRLLSEILPHTATMQIGFAVYRSLD